MVSDWANEHKGSGTNQELSGIMTPLDREERVRPVKEASLGSYNFEPPFHVTLMENNLEIKGTLQTLPPITLKLVNQSPAEKYWDQLVRQHHYLGFKKLLGHRLKYLALMEACPVAALSFSAPGLKVKARDQFIGWSPEQRKQYLPQVANNSRFLIVPGVQVPHLASHVLSLALARLRQDWLQQFQRPLWLLETYVDPQRFSGTCYKAANWHRVGQTSGYTKKGRGYTFHGVPKEVYVYVLEPRFRTYIGCRPQPPRVRRPLPSIQQLEELKMALREISWKPELMPWMDWTEADVNRLADELVAFHGQFHPHYGRLEQHRLGLTYLSGLMSTLEAKSAEPMALRFLGIQSVRSLQRFMKNAVPQQNLWVKRGPKGAKDRLKI
jgi:hypothetical protein